MDYCHDYSFLLLHKSTQNIEIHEKLTLNLLNLQKTITFVNRVLQSFNHFIMNLRFLNIPFRKVSFLFFCFVILFPLQAKDINHRLILTNIDSLLEVSYQHILKIEVDSAIITSSEALVLSESVDYSEGITRANYQIGEMLMTKY